MAKKPHPGSTMTSKAGDLTLDLDFGQYNSDDYLEGDSDLSDFSDSEIDFESDVTLEELAGESLKLSESHDGPEKLSKPKARAAGASNGDSMAVVPAGQAVNDPYQVDSDEEKDILKGIKDEIREMVREEMKSELAVYQHKMKAIEAGRLPSAADANKSKEEDPYPDLADMDPELREAYIKMRKLDRILDKKVKREREVKRDRILLERRIRNEISSLQINGRVQRDIQANTDKYLSLALPPSHNEGVVVEERPITPLFQTQVNENDLQERRQPKPPSSQDTEEDSRASAASSRTDGTASTAGGDRSTKHGRRKKRKKDFIKRNKELAANANDTIAMTDDEKKRLQELLTDVDNLPEIPEDDVNVSVEENPYQVMIHPGEGFLPSDNEMRTLTAIDQRLQSIMPEEDFRSIASSSLSHAPQQRLFTRVGARAEVDFESYGEKALMETKEDREFKASLKEIEDRLASFQTAEEFQAETPNLTEEQLDHLLDDCVRSLSRVSMPADTPQSVDSARTLESARAQLMVNPPRLSEDMLQKLLSEAHFPLSTRLLALQDDDSKSANGDDGVAIRAETWKAIVEERLSDEEEGEGNSASTTPRPTNDTQHPAPTTVNGTPHIPIRQSNVVPHPSLSDPSFTPTFSRRPPVHRYSSHNSDSDGRDSRVSLPEICESPLINMPQGGSAGAQNNQLQNRNGRGSAAHNSSSLENMVFNDLSLDSARSSSSASFAMGGTPLMVEEVEGQGTPVPQPPPLSERRSGSRPIRRTEEKDH